MNGSLFDGVFDGLFDDAAVFPPGNLPLEQAVPAHAVHQGSPHSRLVGAFVLAAEDLGALLPITGDLPAGSLGLSVTVPVAGVAGALAAAAAVPAVSLAGIEAAVPGGMPAAEVVPAIEDALSADVPVFVELPRDARREPLIEALRATSFSAKLRTGGVRAELYPDERELAVAVVSLTRAGVPFKATAGLHHALRNTDPETGFQQHGFLNLLVAAGAARAGADAGEVAALLAERAPEPVVAAVRRLGAEVRESFRSFGTCSITDPVGELADLGVLSADRPREGSA